MSDDERKKLRAQAAQLRRQGKTYAEINAVLPKPVPKGTLSGWLRGVELPESAQTRLRRRSERHLLTARRKANAAQATRRRAYFDGLRQENRRIVDTLKEKNAAKIALAMLYLGEGHKQGGSISFGNAHPEVIKLFLVLLRFSYGIDEARFRVTVQCRADQETEALERFWVEVTGIHRSQFYRPQVDRRTRGKATRKKDYMGVCRIDYFSAHVFNELRIIAELLMGR